MFGRDEMGLTNVEIMVPFVRTLSEAQAWLNGEIASWQKITSEIKIDLTD